MVDWLRDNPVPDAQQRRQILPWHLQVHICFATNLVLEHAVDFYDVRVPNLVQLRHFKDNGTAHIR